MALPAQVQRQAAAVQAHFNPDAQADDADANVEVVEEVVQTADQPPVDDEPSSPPTDEQAGGDTSTEETYEQRWRSLQGKYNAEIPRLHAERRELTKRVEQLEQLLSSLKEAPAEQPDTPAAKLVTEQDVEDYGDSIDVMRRVFREEAHGLQQENKQLREALRQMQASVVPQMQQLSQRQAVSSEQQFWSELQSQVPDWQDINANKDFHSWLLEIDPLSGAPRQTYLDDAQRSLDARRVAGFFTTWKGMTGQANAQQPREDRATSELEKQVAPGKGRTGGNRTATEPKTYTSEDIKKFFADVQRGRYKGREDERNRIESDIFAAQREGRIQTA